MVLLQINNYINLINLHLDENRASIKESDIGSLHLNILKGTICNYKRDISVYFKKDSVWIV